MSLKDRGRSRLDWLLGAVLPLWWERGCDHRGGGFFEGLADDGAAVEAHRRSRVQSRQIYVFAMAGELGWDGPWRETVKRGARAYVDRYFRPDGLFRTLVDGAGAPVDETATVYDQAFSLFALASAQRSGVLEEASALACGVLAALDAARRDGYGLYREAGDRPFQANCHMHLLEAALSWEEIEPEGPWSELADRVAHHALTRFIDPESGALREFFGSDWRPASGRAGDIVEPGHNFEWAWLMERWGRLRDSSESRRAARRLYAVGRRGVDARGVAVDEMDAGLAVTRPGARIWPQTEHVKAAVILAEASDGAERQGYERDAVQALDALRLYIDPAPRGLWRERLQPDGAFLPEYARATSLYHIVCALSEVAARTGRSQHPWRPGGAAFDPSSHDQV